MVERLPLLSWPHFKAIDALQQVVSLEETLPAGLLEALYELFNDLQPGELDMSDLARKLTSGQAALTVEELRSQLDQYVKEITRGCNPDLVRIKIKMS